MAASNETFSIANALFSVITGIVAFFFSNWQLRRLKLLEESLRLQNTKAVNVHQIQFETEFKVYREIWVKLVEVKEATLKLRPTSDQDELGLTQAQIRSQRIQDFNDNYEKFRKAFMHNKPFFSKTVWVALEQIIKTMRREGVEYAYNNETRTNQYWENSEKNAELILQQIEEVSDSIQKRINVLVVV